VKATVDQMKGRSGHRTSASYFKHLPPKAQIVCGSGSPPASQPSATRTKTAFIEQEPFFRVG